MSELRIEKLVNPALIEPITNTEAATSGFDEYFSLPKLVKLSQAHFGAQSKCSKFCRCCACNHAQSGAPLVAGSPFQISDAHQVTNPILQALFFKK